GGPHRGGGVERLVQPATVRGVDRVPPRPAAEQRQGEHHGPQEDRDPRAERAPAGGLRAGLEPALSYGGADDRQRSHAQERAERDERGSTKYSCELGGPFIRELRKARTRYTLAGIAFELLTRLRVFQHDDSDVRQKFFSLIVNVDCDEIVPLPTHCERPCGLSRLKI